MIVRLFILNIFIGLVFAQSPDELLNSAKSNLDAGNLDKAESEYNSALEIDPTFAPAYAGLALVAMRKGDLKQSGSLLNEAIDADPENKEFRQKFEELSELNMLMSQGSRSMKNGDIDDAFESFRIASDKFPLFPGSVFRMGVASMRNKKYEVAVEYFKKTIEINPDHQNALTAINNVAKNYFNQGNKLYKRGDLEGALSVYNKVLIIDGSFHFAHFQIGAINAKMGNNEDAIFSYTNSLMVNPRFFQGYFGRARVYDDMNNKDEAINDLRQAIEINPSYAKAYGALGDIYVSLGNTEEARKTFKLAIAISPDYAKGFKELGRIYINEESWNQAIEVLDKAVELNSRDATGFYLLAQAQNKLEMCNDALDSARKSTEIKSRNGAAWFELGIAQWCNGSGNKAGALNAFEKARDDRAWRKMAEYEIDKVKNPQKYVK